MNLQKNKPAEYKTSFITILVMVKTIKLYSYFTYQARSNSGQYCLFKRNIFRLNIAHSLII